VADGGDDGADAPAAAAPGAAASGAVPSGVTLSRVQLQSHHPLLGVGGFEGAGHVSWRPLGSVSVMSRLPVSRIPLTARFLSETMTRGTRRRVRAGSLHARVACGEQRR
jgi:hypothetical protein